MRHRHLARRWRPIGTIAAATLLGSAMTAGCKPSQILDVPPPTGVTTASAVHSVSGAGLLFDYYKGTFFEALGEDFGSGPIEASGMLADEFKWTYWSYESDYGGSDLRVTTYTGANLYPEADNGVQDMMTARTGLSQAIPLLQKYEVTSAGKAMIGEAFALMAYDELIMAEDYCAGLPLDNLTPNSGTGLQFGTQISQDSLLAVAERNFDSAQAYANGNTTVQYLAQVGLARTLLQRGRFDSAAAAVNGVPTTFVYNASEEPVSYPTTYTAPYYYNFYDNSIFYGPTSGDAQYNSAEWNVADTKGVNGLNYISANDPRLVFDTLLTITGDADAGPGLTPAAAVSDSVVYYPIKFGAPSGNIPISTGIEARLIEAEVALHDGNTGQWAADLNALRAAAPTTYLAFDSVAQAGLTANLLPLGPDSTTNLSASQQLMVQFREKAFWTFGTGLRLGDMRRLVRQYGLQANQVFATGPYPYPNYPGISAQDAVITNAYPNYGNDVALELPSPLLMTDPNPNYKGCMTPTTTA